METDRSIVAAEHVMSQIVDGEAVLLDMRDEAFLGLNEVATRIWENLVEGRTITETIRCLEDEYEVEHEQLQSDVLEFVQSMLERQFLELA